MATPIPQELTTSWQLALEFWSEPLRHKTVLGLAAKHEQLVWLAARYRDASRTSPQDPIAQANLARVRNAAAIVMLAPKAPKEVTRSPFRSLSLLVIGAALATALAFVVTQNKVEQHQRAEGAQVETAQVVATQP